MYSKISIPEEQGSPDTFIFTNFKTDTMQANTNDHSIQKNIILDGFRLYTVCDRLVLDLLIILNEVLQKTSFDQEELSQRILLILNKEPYLSQLLFRDFNREREDRRYSAQSFTYLSEIFVLYRLKPANNLKGRPGNMHLLMEALCRKGPRQWGWKRTSVERRQKICREYVKDVFFAAAAETLKSLREKPGDNLSEVSKGQREKYGRLYLILDDNSAELPEEISLFEALKSLPVPLEDGFANDPGVQKLIFKVLESLNERYMLLRACGLNPEHWLSREELSIGKLKEMRLLRKHAAEKAKEREQDMALYEQSFQELQGDKKKFAGCIGFDEFRQTEAGETFLRIFSLSAPPAPVDDMDDNESEDTPEEKQADRLEWVERLIAAHPKPFQKDPVMACFFRKSLGGGLPLCAEGGVLDDLDFRQLIANDMRYANLDNKALAKKIYQGAKAIIQAGQKRCNTKIR